MKTPSKSPPRAVLKAPQLRENDLETRAADLLFEAEIEVRARKLGGVLQGDAQNGRFSGVLFDGARLSALCLRRAHFEDAVFRGCDMANLDARQVFASRVEVFECRATGLCAPESDWRDVVFESCNLSLCQFRHAKFERVRFKNCDGREADFQNADLRGVVFEACDLRGAQMSFAKLQNADVRTCKTDGLSVDAGALRGLIVSPLQAAQLASILGLQVRWNDANASQNSGY